MNTYDDDRYDSALHEIDRLRAEIAEMTVTICALADKVARVPEIVAAYDYQFGAGTLLRDVDRVLDGSTE